MATADVRDAAECPDDDEPTTGEWLAVVGGGRVEVDRSGAADYEFRPVGGSGSVYLRLWPDGGGVWYQNGDEGTSLPPQRTRGRVRRLLAALDIPQSRAAAGGV